MKAQQSKYTAPKMACCSPRQKVFGLIALGGLFACGLMIGLIINGGHKNNVVYDAQCDALAKKIVDASRGTICRDTSACLELLKELNEVYSVNCAGHVAKIETKDAVTENSDVDTDKSACEIIEEIQQGYLYRDDDSDLYAHQANLDIYKNLIVNGCPENVDKYNELIARETAIIKALQGNASGNSQTCSEIEQVLSYRINNSASGADDYINNAKIYANLSERGCPENSAKYVDLAKKELEIARAIRDDEFSENETIEVVETYKRLEMQAAAEEIFDKVKKITNPAIDFIIQIEKIINE